MCFKNIYNIQIFADEKLKKSDINLFNKFLLYLISRLIICNVIAVIYIVVEEGQDVHLRSPIISFIIISKITFDRNYDEITSLDRKHITVCFRKTYNFQQQDIL